MLLITCGVPDKWGYICAFDRWIYRDPGMHGLPFEFSGDIPTWERAVELLRGIEGSENSIMLFANPTEGGQEVRLLGRIEVSEAHDGDTLLWIGPRAEREMGGYLKLASSEFRGGSLSTNDDDDFFHLRLAMTGVDILVRENLIFPD